MTARHVIALDELDPTAVALAGGKACALASLTRAGLPIPSGAAVTTGAYGEFLAAGGLRERVALELGRKEFADMRWEELWDAALRIRNLFLTTALPADLRESLTEGLGRRLTEVPVVVRSSAPGEDASGVLQALSFLKDVNLGKKPKVGRKVVVVGGGSVAMDVATSAARLGAGSVQVVCLECSHEEMPALVDEIEQAIE